jgi:hypothetical protein
VFKDVFLFSVIVPRTKPLEIRIGSSGVPRQKFNMQQGPGSALTSPPSPGNENAVMLNLGLQWPESHKKFNAETSLV